MMTAGALLSGMKEFYGTQNYYFHPFNRSVRYTDGVKWFLESAECYWLLDIIITEFYEVSRKWTKVHHDTGFIIKVNSKDSKASISVKSQNFEGTECVMFTKQIDFTDLPEGEWTFYYFDNVLLLPSEY